MQQAHRRLAVVFTFLAAANLAANFFVVLFIADEDIRLYFTDVTFPLGNLLTVLTLLLAAVSMKPVSTGASRAWLILGVAQLAYLIADIIWAVLEISQNEIPYPSLADWFYVVTYPLFVAGVLLFPPRRLARNNWLKYILDISIIIVASLIGLWHFVLGPIVAAGLEEPPLILLLNLYYPTADMLLLWAVLAVIYRKLHGPNRDPMLLIALSTTLTIVVDCIYSYQTTLDTYISGSLLDMGWLVSYFLTLLAGARVILKTPTQEEYHDLEIREFQPRKFTTYLPYAWVAGALLVFLQEYPQSPTPNFLIMSICMGAVTVFVLLRQVVTLEENRFLASSLQTALVNVQEQAEKLKASNIQLETEIKVRKHIEEQLKHDAYHDTLTGLPNRASFLEHLTRQVEHAKAIPKIHFAVLLLDLDQFKAVNDTRGHEQGDKLLVMISRGLASSLRAYDMIARFGGDEFIFLIDLDNNVGSIQQVADRILDQVNMAVEIEPGNELFITASMGVVLYDHSYLSADELIRDADIALYQAKGQGKAQYQVFHPDLRKQLLTRAELENDLRYALDQNELEIHYQPVVSLRCDQLAGFEALLRWRHPRRGVIPPSEFIPIAEDLGLLHEIGMWTLHEACKRMHTWQILFPLNPPLTVSVNVSGTQIIKPDFAERVAAILQSTGLPGRSLNLEITEGVYLNITQETSRLFDYLKSLGIKLHIDDFGIGYSSLSYLQRFPADTIKIDRVFISRIANQARGSIIQTIIALAHELGLETVGEGVETEEQLRWLKDYGCDYVQGFLFHKPMNQAAVEDYLHTISRQRAARQAAG